MNQKSPCSEQTIEIALADDHVLVRTAISSLVSLFKRCKVVIEADNGQILLDKLSDCQRLPDICILDINMPVLNGYDTITAVKQKWPALKIIILSMINDEYAIISMFRTGVNGFLLKSCRYDELNQAILKVYNGEYYLQESLLKDCQNFDKKIIPTLSGREIQFLQRCGLGKDYSQISKELNISFRTVETMASRIGEKLNIHSRLGFAIFAIKVGIVMLT